MIKTQHEVIDKIDKIIVKQEIDLETENQVLKEQLNFFLSTERFKEFRKMKSIIQHQQKIIHSLQNDPVREKIEQLRNQLKEEKEEYENKIREINLVVEEREKEIKSLMNFIIDHSTDYTKRLKEAIVGSYSPDELVKEIEELNNNDEKEVVGVNSKQQDQTRGRIISLVSEKPMKEHEIVDILNNVSQQRVNKLLKKLIDSEVVIQDSSNYYHLL